MKLSYNQLSTILSITGKSDNGRYIYAKCPACGENEFYLFLSEENQPSACNRKNKCGVHFNIYSLLSFLGKLKDFVAERDIDIQEKLIADLEIKPEILNLIF